ncbi:efflux RND transporter permease subunit [Massilibacterium senegalense]|uniref:efflux RND transporter permease subunit n=1 Tax=Massilibacterium senegalense TaxID=1632858 RepID=UPI00078420BF|nr:efflux RND transporter permease subunit [Massilibacterium senegalense]
MKKIIRFSLHNKLAIWLLTFLVVAAGIYSGTQMKMEILPELKAPFITVTTSYPGASAEEVAEKVSDPIEKSLESLPGVKTVQSDSYQNFSAITIEYQYEQDMIDAKNEAKEAIDRLTLPEAVDKPVVNRIDLNAFPVIVFDIAYDGKSMEELTTLVEQDLKSKFEKIDGVSTVQISGQRVNEVHIAFDQKKLTEYGLDEEKVKQIIQGTNFKTPLGLYEIDQKEKIVAIDGKVATEDELKDIQIPVTDPAPGVMIVPGESGIPTITLKDVATVQLKGVAESISRTNGKEAIAVQVMKGQDANTVTVVNDVKKAIKEVEKDYKGITITQLYDQGKPIEDSVNTMIDKALIGGLFAIIIILLFLRDIRSTIIAVVSIPMSLLTAILVLKQMGITLNIMTLGALTVAIGRVVDDSIVVIENIYRRMSLKEEKLRGKELIEAATKEMFTPIMSSTIVTVAVFLPLGLVKGQIGELFLPFGLALVFALLASLVVAVTIVPMMAHVLFKEGTKVKKKEQGKIAAGYKKFLNTTLNHKWITSIVATVLLIASFGLVPFIGQAFLPDDPQKMMAITYTPEPGQTLEDIEKVAQDTEKYFKQKKGVEIIQYSIGGNNPLMVQTKNTINFFIDYKDDYENFNDETVKVEKDLQKNTEKGKWLMQNMSSGGFNNQMQLFVYGTSIENVQKSSSQVEKLLKDSKDFKNIDSSLSNTYDKYTFVVDRNTMNSQGLTTAQIAQAFSQVGVKQTLTTIEQDREEINVYVTNTEKEYNTIESLTDETIITPLGQQKKLGDFVSIDEGSAVDTVKRKDGKLYATITAEFTTNDVGGASQTLAKKIDKLSLPQGSSVDYGGVTEDMQKSFFQLGLAMLAAVLIVYFILVVTFGGGLAPFAILFSLPFSVIGGFLALYLSGETINVSSLIGALMLIGIVVTNAIVLIDRVIHKEREGLPTRDALLEAASTRLRPILMTAIATIGALIPLAIGSEGGSGALISKSLGVTVIGGLTSSTLLTLIIVPLVYEVLMKAKKKMTRKKA